MGNFSVGEQNGVHQSVPLLWLVLAEPLQRGLQGVRNQGNLTSSYRPNSGESKKTNQIQWPVPGKTELADVFLEGLINQRTLAH